MTLSTPYALSIQSARRALERYKNLLNKSISKCTIFFASEPFDLKEGYHLHCLLALEKNNISNYHIKKRIIENWRITTGTSNINGKSARIYLKKYFKNKGAHNYISKYIHRKNSDYDFI